MDLAGIEKDPLGDGCLARIDMGHESDVSGFYELLIFRHCWSCPSAKTGLKKKPAFRVGVFHPFDRAKPRFLRRGRGARLRVNLVQAPAFRPGSREVHIPPRMLKGFPENVNESSEKLIHALLITQISKNDYMDCSLFPSTYICVIVFIIGGIRDS
jgi:hypothetical protein